MRTLKSIRPSGFVFATLAIAAAAIIIGMSFVLRTGNRMIHFHAPLIDAIMVVKLDLTGAHLWFEEFIAGDREDIDDIWHRLDSAQWHTNAILQGGQSHEATYIPLEEPQIRNEVLLFGEKLQQFSDLAHQRFDTVKTGKAGADIERKYHDMFYEVLGLADDIETQIYQLIRSEAKTFHIFQVSLITVSILIVIVMALVLWRYVKQQMQAEIQIQNHADFLKTVMDSLAHPFYVINVDDFTVAMANIATTSPEIIEKGITCYALTHGRQERCDSEDHPCPVEIIKKTQKPVTVEHRHYTKDGTERIFEVHGHPIFDRNGNVRQVIEYNLDITERKNIEQEREYLLKTLAVKNKELESIVYVSSHDLRSPLVNIQGFSTELSYSCDHLLKFLDDPEVPDRLRKQLSPILHKDIPDSIEFIQTSINRIDTLLRGLLKLSRMGRAAIQVTEINMNDLVENTLKTMKFQIQQARADVSVEPLPPCIADNTQIGQVFSNIIDNALKYLDPARKGRIYISAQTEEETNVYCIEDNGIGIPEDYQDAVFEIFNQLDPANASGEGLGLTIVKRILERNHGRIWLDAEPGRGSRFYVALPGHS